MKKRLLSLALALVFIASDALFTASIVPKTYAESQYTTPEGVIIYNDPSAWDGVVPTLSQITGSGAAEYSEEASGSSFYIASGRALAYLYQKFNSYGSIISAKVFIIGDIDLGNYVLPGMNGSSTYVLSNFYLYGMDDGITIRNVNLGTSTGCAGLLRRVKNTVTVHDITLENVTVNNGTYSCAAAFIGEILPSDDSTHLTELTLCNITGTSTIRGKNCTASFVGKTSATKLIITGCSSNATVIPANEGDSSGGIVGEACGTMSKLENVRFTGSISSNAQCIGGMVGKSDGSKVYLYLTDCVNSASVSGSYNVGGMAGYCNDLSATNCTNTGNVSRYSSSSSGCSFGGILGEAKACTLTNCKNSGAITGRTQCGGIAGKARTAGGFYSCINEGQVNSTGSYGGDQGPYTGGIVGSCSGSTSVFEKCENKGNIYAKDRYAGGIVGSCEDAASITYCANKGKIDVTMDCTEESYIGGIAGLHRGSVSYCSNVGNISVRTSSSSTRGRDVGGIIGTYAGGNLALDYCYSSGSITISETGTRGSIVGYRYSGTLGSNTYGMYYNLAGSDTSTATRVYQTKTNLCNAVLTNMPSWFFINTWGNAGVYSGYPLLEVQRARLEFTITFNGNGADVNGVKGQYSLVLTRLYGKGFYVPTAEAYVDRYNGTSSFINDSWLRSTDNTVLDKENGKVYTCGTTDASVSSLSVTYTAHFDEPIVFENDTVIYEISNAAELYEFAAIINGTSDKYPATVDNRLLYLNGRLTADIILNDGIFDANGGFLKHGESGYSTPENVWVPIGSNGSFPYYGSFDGGGHTISGMYINNSDLQYAGLFSVCKTGKIEGIHLENFSVTGGNYVGALAGFIESSVENCSASSLCAVSGKDYVGGLIGEKSITPISNCSASVPVNALLSNENSSCAGGLIGKTISSSITDCSASGNVNAYHYAGGIVGETTGSIRRCTASGDIVSEECAGGIAGKTSSIIECCIAAGDVASNSSENSRAGGIAGRCSSGVQINSSYVTGNVSGILCGGIIGITSYSGNTIGITDCCYLKTQDVNSAIPMLYDMSNTSVTNTKAVSEDELTGGAATFLLNGSQSTDNLIWYQNLSGENKDAAPVLDNTHSTVYCGFDGVHFDDDGFGILQYANAPMNGSEYEEPLKNVGEDGIADNDDDYYEINNGGKLYWFENMINALNNNTLYDFNARLTGNVSLNDETFVFDDDTGLVRVNDGTNTAYLGTGIKGVSGGNSSFDATASTVGTWYVLSNKTYTPGTYGGKLRTWTPIGNNKSAYTGSFDGNGCTVSGLYINAPDSDMQGLFGNALNSRLMSICIDKSYIYAKNYVGGVCGNNENGTIESCSNTGTVNGYSLVGGVCGYYINNGNEGSKIENCCNTGKVNGNSNVGGVIGNCSSRSNITDRVNNCYNTGGVTGIGLNIGGVIGCCENAFAKNCYYLNGCATDGNSIPQSGIGGVIADVNGRTASKTASQFASGEVAWLLQSGVPADAQTGTAPLIWGQSDVNTEGSLPMLTSYENNRVLLFGAAATGKFLPRSDIHSLDAVKKTAVGDDVQSGGLDITDESVLYKADLNSDGVVDVLDAAITELIESGHIKNNY